jgi:hypothetical protein
MTLQSRLPMHSAKFTFESLLGERLTLKALEALAESHPCGRPVRCDYLLVADEFDALVVVRAEVAQEGAAV